LAFFEVFMDDNAGRELLERVRELEGKMMPERDWNLVH